MPIFANFRNSTDDSANTIRFSYFHSVSTLRSHRVSYFLRSLLRTGQSPQNVGEHSLGFMPNGPTIDYQLSTIDYPWHGGQGPAWPSDSPRRRIARKLADDFGRLRCAAGKGWRPSDSPIRRIPRKFADDFWGLDFIIILFLFV